ncbi:MAG: PIN domain nuclease [Actinomycetota bacterium]|nr:PIN domain nuclease [Actinomycetota bacterium]
MADELALFLVDTSAWHHAAKPVVAESWQRFAEADRLAVTQPVRLEILYSARNAREYDALSDELDGLHRLPCDDAAFDRALEVQRRLAHRRALHHRSVKLPDLLIAAVAEIGGAVVWHYDRDYDRIASVTGQPTSWIAPRGKL